jgi:hypothetical protein
VKSIGLPIKQKKEPGVMTGSFGVFYLYWKYAPVNKNKNIDIVIPG